MSQRAISVENLLKMKFKVMDFTGVWLSAFGKPERTGSWLIWGHSGNGKTSFALQLAKYLTRFGKVAYDSLEEGARLSMQRALQDINMKEVKDKIILLDREPINELVERLKRRKSPDIVIIDSLQYTGMSLPEYKKLKSMFADKLFIFISHAEGMSPSGRTAKSILYDADVKIRIEGYRAILVSRAGNTQNYFTIWHDGAIQYWGE